MSCINSLSQADIGLSQKVMRNAKTFYHNSTIGARLRDLYYICQTIHGNTKKQKYRNQCFPFQRSTTCSPKRWMQNMFSKPRHFFCPHPTPRSPFNPRSGKLGTYSYKRPPSCSTSTSTSALVPATTGFLFIKLNFLRHGVGGVPLCVCVPRVRSCEKLLKMSPPPAFINPIFHRYVNFSTKFQ